MRKLPQYRLGPFIGNSRDDDLDFDKLVAAQTRLNQRWRAPSSQAQDLTILGTRRYTNDRSPINCWYLYLSAEYGLRESDGQPALNVVARTAEKWMRPDIRDDIKISRRPPASSGISLFGKTHPRTRGNSSRNPDFHDFRTQDTAFTKALGTIRDDASGTATVFTRNQELQPALRPRQVSAASARWTSAIALTRRTATSTAGRATLAPLNVDPGIDPRDGILKADGHLVFNVHAALRLAPRHFP